MFLRVGNKNYAFRRAQRAPTSVRAHLCFLPELAIVSGLLLSLTQLSVHQQQSVPVAPVKSTDHVLGKAPLGAPICIASCNPMVVGSPDRGRTPKSRRPAASTR